MPNPAPDPACAAQAHENQDITDILKESINGHWHCSSINRGRLMKEDLNENENIKELCPRAMPGLYGIRRRYHRYTILGPVPLRRNRVGSCWRSGGGC